MAEQVAEKAKQGCRGNSDEAQAARDCSTKKTDVLTKHIAAEIKKDPAVLAQVVRSWLHGDTTQR